MIETKKVSLNDKIAQCSGLIVSNMDGEKVMLSIANGKYYNLGEMGSIIWTLIEKPTKVNKIISHLVSNYVVKQEECEEDVLVFLESLLNENIIKITENEK